MHILNSIFRATSKISHQILRVQERARNIHLSRMVLFATTERETAYCAHLIVAVLFYSKFFMFGDILAANSDLLLHNYPMLLLAKKNFLEGSLGLWNSYAFSGAPQSVGAVAPALFPENWL